MNYLIITFFLKIKHKVHKADFVFVNFVRHPELIEGLSVFVAK